MSNKKHALLVTGPESSGSRHVHNLIQAAGCQGVKYVFSFPEDGRRNEIFSEEDYSTLDEASEQIVWHRSVPDGAHVVGRDKPVDHLFPPLAEMIEQLRQRDYRVHLIVCVRDHVAMIKSQINRQMAADMKDGVRRVRAAYEYIFAVAPRADSLLVVSYDSLVTRPKASKVFVEGLGLKYVPVEVKDATAKWYL